MQNHFYSLMDDVRSDGDRLEGHAGSVSVDQLQSLRNANERLRTIVAELLLKNEALRSKLAHYGSSELLHAAFQDLDRLK
jgi:hypothetical protein